jgi:hypothetical protein
VKSFSLQSRPLLPSIPETRGRSFKPWFIAPTLLMEAFVFYSRTLNLSYWYHKRAGIITRSHYEILKLQHFFSLQLHFKEFEYDESSHRWERSAYVIAPTLLMEAFVFYSRTLNLSYWYHKRAGIITLKLQHFFSLQLHFKEFEYDESSHRWERSANESL